MKVTIKYKGNGLKPLPFSIIIIPQNCSENKATIKDGAIISFQIRRWGGVLLDKDWMILLKGQNQLSNVIKTNETTERFGLSLTEQDAKLILAERKNALAEQKRIEFGEGIATKIIYEFCDSEYIHQSNYVETIIHCRKYFIYIKMKCMMKLQMMNFSI